MELQEYLVLMEHKVPKVQLELPVLMELKVQQVLKALKVLKV
jgi:hypothetical protein